MMANYKKLIVWQKADELAVLSYKYTDGFPKREMFGLTSQIRRAAISIPSNIVEGYNRKTKREFKRFLDISLGSLAEVEYLLEISKKVGILKDDCDKLFDLIAETGRLLWSFQKSLGE
jgi:four helix bundle protein